MLAVELGLELGQQLLGLEVVPGMVQELVLTHWFDRTSKEPMQAVELGPELGQQLLDLEVTALMVPRMVQELVLEEGQAV
jgi:hypothetical protein